ncbi:Protein dehydration-induced 19 C-terminal protein [Dioscorea alata]|uniref:Protein dehydration-induced 19 C-terminal protein n=1 Tax=Dioscorea alata TaxID=55571 RepID=A0ACB7V0A3_DIOAL|nr:Protein dehydration-induced 19 C-terminal protein [Dioscorea alata]
MASDSWRCYKSMSRSHNPAHQSLHDMYSELEENDGGDWETSYACPFCEEDFDILELCCHIVDEHPAEAKNGVLNSIIRTYLQLRRKFHKGSSGYHSMLSLLKEVGEGYLQDHFDDSSCPIATTSTSPDPLLSSLICTLPTADSSRDPQPDSLDEESLTNECSNEKVVESVEPSLPDKDQEERAQRSEFVQGLLLSTIYEL